MLENNLEWLVGVPVLMEEFSMPILFRIMNLMLCLLQSFSTLMISFLKALKMLLVSFDLKNTDGSEVFWIFVKVALKFNTSDLSPRNLHYEPSGS